MSMTYEEALLIEQHNAIRQAVTDGRLSAESAAIVHDLLDGKIDQAEADKRQADLAGSVLP